MYINVEHYLNVSREIFAKYLSKYAEAIIARELNAIYEYNKTAVNRDKEQVNEELGTGSC